MSLSLYKKKRNFDHTPEPEAAKGIKKSAHTFVVQRHDASRLHYDFRLEMAGVLKSWAVPKGPSMVAGEKRLAVMVEDHPLSYGKFYGEIPAGNYGAGIVDVWDNGTYTPVNENAQAEKTLIAQLHKGDLKFRLKGRHLKGEFALVRMDDTNNWLLIKKKDEYALEKYNIADTTPLKSAGKKKVNKETVIKTKEKPVTAKTTVQKKHAFPATIPSPMLAKLTDEIIDNTDYIYEIKYDGYRVIAAINKGKAELSSRNGNSFTTLYHTITQELHTMNESVILDGEIVIENKKNISDFQLLQNYKLTKEGVLQYYVFDILFLNGYNVTSLPLLERKELLSLLFKKYTFRNIHNAAYHLGRGKKTFDRFIQKGYEGMIAKDSNSLYTPGKRTGSWLKIKITQMQEAVICGYTLPQKSRKYFGSLILGVYENARLQYIGNCGTGFTDTSLMELHTAFEKLKTVKCSFETVPKMTGAKGRPVWVTPKLVCNIKFLEWTQDGHLRNPVFMGLRTDKKAKEVMREKAAQTGTTKKTTGVKDDTISVSGKKVKITHPDKVYWPDDGYTKQDLVNYYHSVSKYILPYLKNRPQSLNRHPNGAGKPGFYQKDMDIKQIPGWAKTAKMYSKSNNAYLDYLICNDTATLLYMANLGCIEINPWHSKYTRPDNPDYLMLDLDPGDISFINVVNTALIIKEICDEISIPAYCKTSGATGLHIYIPLAAKYTYEEGRAFAEILAAITHQRLPDTTSIERSLAKRKDKIYIDFLQNSKGQTIVAPYSVRPRPGATVSTPLLWKEVNHQLNPQMFTIQNTLKRLHSVGDLWQAVLKKGINLQKALKAIEKL